MSDGWNIALLGATGAVGSALLELLQEREFPVGELYPLASERSVGKSSVLTVNPAGWKMRRVSTGRRRIWRFSSPARKPASAMRKRRRCRVSGYRQQRPVRPGAGRAAGGAGG